MSDATDNRFYREKFATLGQSERAIAERTQAEMNDVANAEREACVAILEELRPRNDRSDWTQWAKDRDEVLSKAIALISARYESKRFVPACTCHPDDRNGGDCPREYAAADCAVHRHLVRDRFANDVAAKALYDTWSDQPGWVPWVDRGNSTKQEDARREVML